MKLIVTIPGSRFAADLPDEACVTRYRVFVDTLLDTMTNEDDYIDDDVPDKRPNPEPVSDPEHKQEIYAKESDEPVVAQRGFLHLKCPHCGGVFGFCSKHERDHVICKECGQEFGFDQPLVALYVNCECGSSFKYYTNRTEPIFDIECLNCKAPVSVEYIVKRQLYQTIRRGSKYE